MELQGKMKIIIEIPPKDELLKKFCCVHAAPQGTQWRESCLNGLEKERGVYVFHKHGDIKYVGMTGGDKTNFGVRLRRHLQEKAAAKHGIYEKLREIKKGLCVSFITDKEILKCMGLPIPQDGRAPKSVMLLMEAAMIHAYEPKFQQEKV